MTQQALRLAMILGAVAVGALAEIGSHAAEYIPGQHRADGLYVQPHFRDQDQRAHAAEVWYEALIADSARTTDEIKLPPGQATEPAPLPPGATKPEV